MPFVERDAETSEIVGLFARPQHDGQERLNDDDAEVVAFNAPPAPIEPAMSAEDIWLALEDLGLVTPADVPPGRRQPPRV